MSVSATYISQLSVTESIGNVPLVDANQSSILHDKLNRSVSLSGSTTPAVSVVIAETFALTAGAGTIDLTAMTGTNGATVNATGLKAKLCKIHNPATNAAFTVKAGATNPYPLLGAAFLIVLQPDQEILAYLLDAGSAVSSTVKSIDLAGTGTQAIEMIIVFG